MAPARERWRSTECHASAPDRASCADGLLVGAAPDREQRYDQQQGHEEEQDRNGGGDAGQAGLDQGAEDVELQHHRRGAGPAAAAAHHVDVGENGGQHRDDADDDVELDDQLHLGQEDEAHALPPGCAIQVCRLDERFVEAEQPRQEQDDAEGRFPPDDEQHHRPQRDVRRADPVERQEIQAQPAQHFVHGPAELEHLLHDDGDDGDRQDVRHEQHDAIELPAFDPLIEHDRYQQRPGYHDGYRQEEEQVVSDRLPEQALTEDQLVVPNADPRAVDAAHQLEAEFEDPDQRVTEDEREQDDERQDVEIRRQPGGMG